MSEPPIPRQLRQKYTERFDFLGGVLPGTMAPTDIDQALERNGHFLFIECKRPGQKIPRGQEITFDRLVGLSDNVRVMVVFGTPPDEIVSYRWWGGDDHDATVHDVRDLVRRWFDWASSQRQAA